MSEPQQLPSNQRTHCPHCGAKNLTSFKFCQSCGKPLPWAQIAPPDQILMPPQPTPPATWVTPQMTAITQKPAKKSTPAWQLFTAIGGGTLLFFGLLGGLMDSPKPAQEAAVTSPRVKPTAQPKETAQQRRTRLALLQKQKTEARERQKEEDKRADVTAHREANPLELLKWSWQSEEYSRYIVGTIRNNTDKTLTYAEIKIGLYDEQGNQVGSTLTNVNGLEPDKVWKFKAVVIEDSATDAKIIGIDGF